jgi:hypothetical protein
MISCLDCSLVLGGGNRETASGELTRDGILRGLFALSR